MDRSATIAFRISDAERDEIEAAAAASDRSISSFVRLSALAAAGRTSLAPQQAALAAGLRAVAFGELEPALTEALNS